MPSRLWIDQTCGGCRFQINEQCRWGPPAVVLVARPTQSPTGIILGKGNSQAHPPMQMVPTSLYHPAPDHMQACSQRRDIVGDHCEEEEVDSGASQEEG